MTATFQSFACKMRCKSLESVESWDGYTCSISSLTAQRRYHMDLKLKRRSSRINGLTRKHKNDMKKKLSYEKYLQCISMDLVFSPTLVLYLVVLSPIISSIGSFTGTVHSWDIIVERLSQNVPYQCYY